MESSTGVRRTAAVLLVLTAGLLALALLAPSSSRQSEMASWIVDLGRGVGLPARWVTQNRAEFLGNALIVAPVVLLAGLVWPGLDWRDWTALSFAGALLVELVQGVALPARTASFEDVVANTLGGLLGGAALALLQAVSRRRTAAGTPPSSRARR